MGRFILKLLALVTVVGLNHMEPHSWFADTFVGAVILYLGYVLGESKDLR